MAMQNVAHAGIPVQFILGQFDQMTPPKSAKTLMELAPSAHVSLVPAGHALMSEAPDAVLTALKTLLR